MEDYKLIIAKNISELRKANKLTQAELAEKLHYSDKAISRWERGDTLPTVDVLCELCDLFGVDLSYLVNTDLSKKSIKTKKTNVAGNKLTICLLTISILWLIATCVYVYSGVTSGNQPWMIFVWAIPASALAGQIYNHFWGHKNLTIYILSIFIWSLLLAFYLQFLNANIWLIFMLGLPMEVCVILWCRLK